MLSLPNPQKSTYLRREMRYLTQVGGALSQCARIANHHAAYFKYLTILFVSYSSIKLKHILGVNGNPLYYFYNLSLILFQN